MSLRKLDKYIFKKFLGTFFYSLTLIISIAVIFDISEKIDDFIEKDAPLSAIVFDYYFSFIPFFANLFSPLFTFIAVIFFTSKMASNTEIVAILSSGISFRRMLVPYFAACTIIAALSVYLNNVVIPRANEKRLEFENIYIQPRFTFSARNIHAQVSPGVFIRLDNYNNFNKTGFQFTLEKFEENKLTYKLSSNFIRWDSIASTWRLENYVIRTIKGSDETIKTGSEMDSTLAFFPSDFEEDIDNLETMNYWELKGFIKQLIDKGSEDVVYYEVEFYRRWAIPFASFILTLMGVSIASRKVRGGIGLHIGAGLLLSFAYILFMQVSTTFATSGSIPALIAVWIPNILFGVVAVYLFRMTPK